MPVITQIKLRKDTAADWASVNPVLALGEPGFEVDTNKLKIGNGTDAWATLDYASGGASVFVGTTAPVDPEANSLWWNSETGGLYILYGTTWVDASPAVAGPQGPQGIQGPVGPQGPQGEPGTPADSSALIPNSIIDAAGDLIVGSAADTPVRLALGTNGQVLTSNGTTATWAAPAASGGYTLLASGTPTGSFSINLSDYISSSYKELFLEINNFRSTAGGFNFSIGVSGNIKGLESGTNATTNTAVTSIMARPIKASATNDASFNLRIGNIKYNRRTSPASTSYPYVASGGYWSNTNNVFECIQSIGAIYNDFFRIDVNANNTLVSSSYALYGVS